MFKSIRKVKIVAIFAVAGALVLPTTPASAAPVEITLSCFNDLNMGNLLKEWETVNPNIKVWIHISLQGIPSVVHQPWKDFQG